MDHERWLTYPIGRILGLRRRWRCTLRPHRHAASAIHPATATVLGRRQWDDGTLICYGYEHDGDPYAFCWETHHDEVHRWRGRNPGAEFYDRLERGTELRVRLVPARPQRHVIVDADLAPMNQRVYYLDPRWG